ncbi:MAG: NAD(P)-dependent alcohol dehydrogenase [Myxococcota bacterium]
MLAARVHRYGPPEVLAFDDLPTPEPGPGEALIRVRAAAVNPKDVIVRKGKFRWLTGPDGGRRFPLRVGQDFAGEIVSSDGPDAPGTRVFGMLGGLRTFGACATHLVAKHDWYAPTPEGLSDVDAAAIPLAALTALQALRDDARLAPGQSLLINGASGGVGVYAVQLGKILGARVTGVSSARNRDLVKGLGADAHVDYAARELRALDERFDVIFDVYGNRSPGELAPVLAKGGTYVTTVPSPAALGWQARSYLGGARSRLVVVRSRRADLEQLAHYARSGLLRAVVDKELPFAELAAAHAHVQTRRARGKVVVTLPASAGV